MHLDAAVAILQGAHGKRTELRRQTVEPGSKIGRYRIVGEHLGQGGSGTVYPAEDTERGGAYAIKLAAQSLPHAEEIFAEEQHRGRLLNHPNILVACDGGVHEERPYLVFRRLHGHLTEPLRRKHFANPHAIAVLMQKIAEALHFAHGRGVLHCDLKPSNILFDGIQPHLADFGLARTLEAFGSRGDAYGGTRGWMSPEQVERTEALGVESDIFSLGVLLFWLLHDEVLPFGNGADFEHRVRNEAPRLDPSKARFRGRLASDLEAICDRALQKHPNARYRSADCLRDDVTRALNGALPRAVTSWRASRKLTRLVRQRPLVSLTGLGLLALSPYAVALQSDALREVRAIQRPQARFGAEAQASAVMTELIGMSQRVHAMANDPAVVALIEHDGIGRQAPALAPHTAGFDSVNVFAADGSHRARFPVGPESEARNVLYADHFSCAERIALEVLEPSRASTPSMLPVCVARAHRSRLDKKVKLGLAAPLFVAGRFAGVVEASTIARDRFGALRMSCGSGDCFTALLGPRDRDDPQQPIPGVLSVLAQEGVALGSEVRLPLALSQEICSKIGCTPDPLRPFEASVHDPFVLDDYQDPVSRAHSLAVVAPVGHTGLSVLMAMPHSASNAKLTSLLLKALRGVWVPLSMALAFWLLLLFAPNPRSPWLYSSR
jgi:hypothetical protein